MTLHEIPMFQPLTGLYEPSAIQQLADGRFLVVEDEKNHPFSLVTISAAGDVSSTPLLPPEQGDDAVWKLDDLEALALDRAGYVYALTSHSRDADGDEKKSRDKLVRFRVEGERMAEPMLVRGLKPALVAAHPVLAAAAEIRDVKSRGGLNIEALEISADGRQLLVGFRSPLLDEQAIIACVENPAAIFESRRATPHRAQSDHAGSGRQRDSRPVLHARSRRLSRDQRSRRTRAGSVPALVLERSSRARRHAVSAWPACPASSTPKG